eukprot:TRINITY_DN3302_c0_g1_i2.p1 TRINITY_DN3302_c0_g1~~TRINITY_DN3302_c0_g1_i2.p1  ORF type:complete len:324 (-),score=69.27 TRINITY_DN3302_c0_g1_i2:125-1096(-)
MRRAEKRQTVEESLAEFLQAIPSLEKHIETARVVLGQLDYFDSTTAFRQITGDPGVEMTPRLLVDFFESQGVKAARDDALVLFAFANKRALEGISLTDFQEIIYSKASPARKVEALRREIEMTVIDEEKIRRAITAFLERELEFCREIEKRRQLFNMQYGRTGIDQAFELLDGGGKGYIVYSDVETLMSKARLSFGKEDWAALWRRVSKLKELERLGRRDFLELIVPLVRTAVPKEAFMPMPMPPPAEDIPKNPYRNERWEWIPPKRTDFGQSIAFGPRGVVAFQSQVPSMYHPRNEVHEPTTYGMPLFGATSHLSIWNTPNR